MRIAICEDSPDDMEILKKSLTEALKQLDLHMDVDYFYSGVKLIEAVENQASYSLCLLDIYMPSIDGIQTARRVRELLPDIQFAFLTMSRDFMLDAFDLNALHYLIKPVSIKKLRECLERFCERTQYPQKMLEIRSNSRLYTFPLTHVQKILSYNKGIDIYLRGASFPQHIPISFVKVEAQLDSSRFLKISRGFLVQMSYILCIDQNTCRLKDGTEVLISRREKANIRKKYNDYLFQ